jgi:integrase
VKYVQPIRDKEIIEDIKRKLFQEEDKRNYILFVIGINVGFRISDILPLRVRDLKKPLLYITEKKTRKQKAFEMNPSVRRELLALVKDRPDDEFLIKSREGVNKPLGRSMTYKIMRAITQEYKLEGIGNHTLRKTYGYHFYKETKDIATLQKIFNHSDPNITLRYIGITQDTINLSTRRFKL